jgi:hypothetical protein
VDFIFLAGFGWIWLDLAGFGWIWLDLAGVRKKKWFYLVLPGAGGLDSENLKPET